MSAKKHKRARAMAMSAASKQKLWAKGEEEVKKSFWRRLGWLFSKRFREKWQKAIGRWYRANIKAWAHDFYQRERDGEMQALAKARRRIARIKRNALTRKFDEQIRAREAAQG